MSIWFDIKLKHCKCIKYSYLAITVKCISIGQTLKSKRANPDPHFKKEQKFTNIFLQNHCYKLMRVLTRQWKLFSCLTSKYLKIRKAKIQQNNAINMLRANCGHSAITGTERLTLGEPDIGTTWLRFRVSITKRKERKKWNSECLGRQTHCLWLNRYPICT